MLAADTPARERDGLVTMLITIQEESDERVSLILEILAEVIDNQLNDSSPVKFNNYQQLIPWVPKDPQKTGSKYLPMNSKISTRRSYEQKRIEGAAVVARWLLSTICQRLLDKETKASTDVAKRVVKILAKLPLSEREAKTKNLKYYHELRIDEDINALIKLSRKQPAEFSEFIFGKRKFEVDLDVAPKIAPKKLTALGSKSDDNQKADSTTDDQLAVLYRGKKVAEWLRVLESDLDPKTQADALRACAALYLSNGQYDKLIALLQSYIQRNANLFRGEEMANCFSGFEDSLRKLPAKKIAEFFKLQLKQGTATSIDWVYRGVTYTRLPLKASNQLRVKNLSQPSQAAWTEKSYRRRYIGMPVSSELREQLESDTVDLLHLIAARDNDDSTQYLSNFVARRLLKDPVSDESISSFKTILTKLDRSELSEALDILPNHALTAELFSQLFDPGIERNYQYLVIYNLLSKESVSEETIAWIKKIIPKLDAYGLQTLLTEMPSRYRIPEVFVAAKDQLFATSTSDYDRSGLIISLVRLKETTDEQASLILEIFADVIVNQLNARDSFEIKGDFDSFWRMNDSGEETSKHAVVARRLLSIICEQIIDPKTLMSLRDEFSDSSGGSATSNRRSSNKSAQLERYINKYFQSHDADNSGIIEGDELKGVKPRSKSKYDLNKDNKIEKQEMLAVLGDPSMQLSDSITANLLSPRSRSKAAKLAKKILAILAKQSSSDQEVDSTELTDFKKLEINHDIEMLKKLSKKQSGEFSHFIDAKKRKFQGDREVKPAPKQQMKDLLP